MGDTREFTSNDVFRAMHSIHYHESNSLYWIKRANERLSYLKPLLDELEVKGYKLKYISHSLYMEYLELLEIKKQAENYDLDKKLPT